MEGQTPHVYCATSPQIKQIPNPRILILGDNIFLHKVILSKSLDAANKIIFADPVAHRQRCPFSFLRVGQDLQPLWSCGCVLF